jgi:hypothetical protein
MTDIASTNPFPDVVTQAITQASEADAAAAAQPVTQAVTQADPEGEPTQMDAALALVQAAIAAGTLYTETFTMKQAGDAWNATRQPFKNAAGKVLFTPEQQYHALDAAWFDEHPGDLTLRRPSMYDTAALRVRIAQLGKGAPLDATTEELLTGVAVCEMFLTKRPDWFDLTVPGADLDDAIKLVLFWHLEWGASFRSKSRRSA